MTHFTYEISVEPLAEPIGNLYRFVAKIASLYESTGGGEISLNPGLGEALGSTKEEARLKMDEKVKKWIAARR